MMSSLFVGSVPSNFRTFAGCLAGPDIWLTIFHREPHSRLLASFSRSASFDLRWFSSSYCKASVASFCNCAHRFLLVVVGFALCSFLAWFWASISANDVDVTQCGCLCFWGFPRISWLVSINAFSSLPASPSPSAVMVMVWGGREVARLSSE
jgi:hypothetical protein